ncbi:hypothetical protein GCM10023107_42900 [Actinoplanes octamycinicus]|nr:hypothetical protein Aoc01nite_56030 [Actinoplanes octamycinicus]
MLQAQQAVRPGQPGHPPGPLGELRPGQRGQLIGEVRPGRPVLQRGDLFVGDVRPVRVCPPGPRIGEDVPVEVRFVVVEQPDRAGQPAESGGVRQDVADLVDQGRRGRLQLVEHSTQAGPHGPHRVAGDRPAGEPAGHLGQPVEMGTLGGGQPQRAGERGDHLR